MDKAKTERTYVILGALLRQRRSEAGLVQDDIAAAVKIERSHLSRIESGKKRISIVRLLQLCEALDTDSGRLISELKERLDYEG